MIHYNLDYVNMRWNVTFHHPKDNFTFQWLLYLQNNNVGRAYVVIFPLITISGLILKVF